MSTLVDHARSQQIGGVDGLMVDALCEEIDRLRAFADQMSQQKIEPYFAALAKEALKTPKAKYKP